MYALVLAPVAGDVAAANVHTLYFSLDDALRYVPPAALMNPQTGRYVAQDFDTGMVTLAGSANATPQSASQQALGLGVSASQQALGLGVSASQQGLPALPGVVQELDGIVRQPGETTGLLPGRILIDVAFTRDSLTQALAGHSYTDVDIASHFLLTPTDTASYLVLGDGSEISVADLRSDPNRLAGVQLLTLSACDTAEDLEVHDGHEVEGFGALMQQLGAQSVVASLWPVSDASTPQLIQALYAYRVAHPGVSAQEALRQAQLTMINGGTATQSIEPAPSRGTIRTGAPAASNAPAFTPDAKAPFAHPYYWAPFVVFGTWNETNPSRN
jgi:CHAT domain-containing protein